MNRPAEGVHDRVFAKALVVTDGTRKFALVTADVLGFPPPVKPALLRLLADDGWTKDDVRHFLFEHARIDRALLPEQRELLSSPAWFAHIDRLPVARGPEEFHVVVAGGIGPQLMIEPPWGLSAAVTRQIETV